MTMRMKLEEKPEKGPVDNASADKRKKKTLDETERLR
jgi:hypothetical protein